MPRDVRARVEGYKLTPEIKETTKKLQMLEKMKALLQMGIMTQQTEMQRLMGMYKQLTMASGEVMRNAPTEPRELFGQE